MITHNHLCCFVLAVAASGPLALAGEKDKPNQPPAGFRALFNGKDMSAWRGQIDEDPRRVAKVLEGLSPEKRQQKQLEADEKTLEHWVVRDGTIHYDGTRKIGNIETREQFGDFELYLDWKIGPKGDSGVFLRGLPQVQIWDPQQWKIGSGGLYNNKPKIDPLKTADKPTGEWNTFHFRMVGDKVWIRLNGETVIDGAVQDNYWSDFKQPAPPRGPIVLQSHGTPLWFRNIYIKELTAK